MATARSQHACIQLDRCCDLFSFFFLFFFFFLSPFYFNIDSVCACMCVVIASSTWWGARLLHIAVKYVRVCVCMCCFFVWWCPFTLRAHQLPLSLENSLFPWNFCILKHGYWIQRLYSQARWCVSTALLGCYLSFFPPSAGYALDNMVLIPLDACCLASVVGHRHMSYPGLALTVSSVADVSCMPRQNRVAIFVWISDSAFFSWQAADFRETLEPITCMLQGPKPKVSRSGKHLAFKWLAHSLSYWRCIFYQKEKGKRGRY